MAIGSSKWRPFVVVTFDHSRSGKTSCEPRAIIRFASRRGIATIAEAYDINVQAFAPAIRHLRADIAAGHASLLDIALADVKAIESERLHRIVNMLHDLKHAYDQLHDGILQYYSDISNYIPRLQVDYFSL
jgi:hypothetical protein